MPSGRDPKRNRMFAVVSRQMLIDSRFSSVVCAPIYSRHKTKELKQALQAALELDEEVEDEI